jgi:hypothetical protein
MAKTIRKFVSREFAQTVDLGLLQRLLMPYAEDLAFATADLPANEREHREALFEFFRGADERVPQALQDALHCICMLSNANGVRILLEQAERLGRTLIPAEEYLGLGDGRHLAPRHVALRAYLDHREIFDRALDLHAFLQPPSPMELVGLREGVACLHEDAGVQEAFRRAAADYFAQRYSGRFCRVRWYSEGDEVDILVLHGKNMAITNVEEDGEERPLSFREIAQDTIRYQPTTGRLRISARYEVEKKELARLFATHLLGNPQFFAGADAQNLYTLAPINRAGPAFRFRSDWDRDLQRVRVTEIEVDEGEDDGLRRKRHSSWSMRVRDEDNAILRLAELVPDLDWESIRINYLKLEFTFSLGDKPRRIIVKVKPPVAVSFRRDAFEVRILEHLRRNGFCLDRELAGAAVAAD